MLLVLFHHVHRPISLLQDLPQRVRRLARNGCHAVTDRESKSILLNVLIKPVDCVLETGQDALDRILCGAISFNNEVWIMRDSDPAADFIRDFAEFVRTQGGSSSQFHATALDANTEAEIIQRFQRDWAEEYAELKEQSLDFLNEIENETQRKNYSFAEYEENEQDLAKLNAWYQRIRWRDFLLVEQATQAEEWLEKCRIALQGFIAQVYDREDPGVEVIKIDGRKH